MVDIPLMGVVLRAASAAAWPAQSEEVPALITMTEADDLEHSIRLASGQTVSALWTEAADPVACLVLAHGAGAGMRHPFMAAVAEGMAQRGVTVLRYQFPYMEAGSKRVDSPPVAHATVRAAVDAAIGSLPLFAGGKSFGARMPSQAQAVDPLPAVRGLVFFGFPLHPAGKPSTERARHLSDVQIPMLFLQGTRDALAEIGLVKITVQGLGERATLVTVPEADHSFHIPARSGRKDAEVLQDMLDRAAGWMRQVTHADQVSRSDEGDRRARVATIGHA